MKKRRPLSMIRLYMLANSYAANFPASDEKQRRGAQSTMRLIADFLGFVFEHKNDEL